MFRGTSVSSSWGFIRYSSEYSNHRTLHSPSTGDIWLCGMRVLWVKTARCRTLFINSYLVYFSRMRLKHFELNTLDFIIISYTVNFHQSGCACVFALSRHCKTCWDITCTSLSNLHLNSLLCQTWWLWWHKILSFGGLLQFGKTGAPQWQNGYNYT